MKVIENPPVLYVNGHNLEDDDGYTFYKCRECGAINRGGVYYSEIEYGQADLVDLENIELDNYETNDHDNFEITLFKCWECENEGYSADAVFISCDEDGNVNPSEE